MFDSQVSTFEPGSIIATSSDVVTREFPVVVENSIEAIKSAMRNFALITVASSWGKDSSAVVTLVIEAATQLRAEGIKVRIRVMTSDTLVDSAPMIRLAKHQAQQMTDIAAERDLDIEQVFVTPDPIDHYLVTMIGGRGTASVAGSDATCSVDLKVRPMQKYSRELAKQYGKENICNFIGTRFEESTERSARMTKRGESDIRPIEQDDGMYQMSPISNWTVGEVWQLLNGNEKSNGFETLDFTRTVAVYEAMGEFTCDTLSVNTSAKAKSPCSGGRGGCVICQKVTVDNSMDQMLGSYPYLAPLARFSKVIQAGHFLPENRSYLAKSVDKSGLIRAFANGYSADWQANLLKWAMTIDAREDEYVETKTQKTGRQAERRFGRLLEAEHLWLIAFSWARYGHQKPGEFARIVAAVDAGERFEMPSDEAIEDMKARAERKSTGKTMGYLAPKEVISGGAFRDNWRDLISAESACAPDLMIQDGDRAMYVASSGTAHDTIGTAPVVSSDLSGLREQDGSFGLTYEEFKFWHAIEFADGRKTHNDEMMFLLREGIVKARKGYQSQIATYQSFNLMLDDLKAEGSIGSLEQIQNHPRFISEADAAEMMAEMAENEPAAEQPASVEAPSAEIHEEQLVMDFAA